jgi:hypothetical protein
MARGMWLFALALLLAPLAGCAPSLESKLVGRWRLDTQSIDLQKAMEERMKQATEGNEAGAAMAQAMMAGMMQAMMQNVQINVEMGFQPDHTFSSEATATIFGQSQTESQTGTWKVESTGDNQLTVSITTAEGRNNTVVIKFVDDNTFTATGHVPGAGDQQAKFTRVTQG